MHTLWNISFVETLSQFFLMFNHYQRFHLGSMIIDDKQEINKQNVFLSCWLLKTNKTKFTYIAK